MSKSCALCKAPARTFCESDQATLCWDCDAKVHGANFLVARHSRTLLCHACQAPTPWRASGTRLGHTISVCDSCVTGAQDRSGRGSGDNGDLHEDDADEDEDEDADDDEGGGGSDDDEGNGGDGGDRDGRGDEDGDNQVVPWSSTTTPPPPAASSSSSEESISNLCCGYGDVQERGAVKMCSSKRMIEDCSDLRSQEKLKYSSFRPKRRPMSAARTRSRDGEATSVDSLRPAKDRRVGRDGFRQGPSCLD